MQCFICKVPIKHCSFVSVFYRKSAGNKLKPDILLSMTVVLSSAKYYPTLFELTKANNLYGFMLTLHPCDQGSPQSPRISTTLMF